MAQWNEQWSKRQATAAAKAERDRRAMSKEQKVASAAAQTQEAQAALAALDGILAHTLGVDDAVDWETLKGKGDYPVPKPAPPAAPPEPSLPADSREPREDDEVYLPVLNFMDKIVRSRREAKEDAAYKRFIDDHAAWKRAHDEKRAAYARQRQEHAAEAARLAAEHRAEVEDWERDRAQYLQHQTEANATIEQQKAEYLSGNPDSIVDYCDLVLAASSYPDYFPQSYDLDYVAETRTLVVDYQLPAKAALPTTKEVRYVASRNEFDTKSISEREQNALYDSLLYQIALRTVHELYEADVADALDAVVFNGYVRSMDRATGQEQEACVLSLPTRKEEFEAINLAAVDPKACFKALKGVGAAKLHSMTPVAPVMRIEREDGRFVEGRTVVDGVAEGDNLASMPWEDFEHLIREIFEKEFAAGGGEVRVTQASRDGGVDAVIFDPDPIRGGKIVIQAKRYTNTVGVGAVRDLYGTVMNEGAMKGILVTTSDYGPDAYSFAQGKPITLLSGGNLLHLLERHGHRARIDLHEAKKTAAQQSSA